MDFIAYASGSAGNFYVVRDGDRRLLIDAGIRWRDIQIALNFDLSNVDGCLLTHAHGDHARSIEHLLSAAIDCYASLETWRSLGLSSRYRFVHTLEPNHQLHIGLPKVQSAGGSIDGWTVLPFEVVHDVPGTLGFYILGPSGKRLAFLTDTAYSPVRFTGCNILAVECNWSSANLRSSVDDGRVDPSRANRTIRTHMSLERLIDMLGKNDLSTVEEIHLLHLSDDNSDERAFRDAVRAATGIATYVAGSKDCGVPA